jgi:hypothetical protein
MKKYYCKDCKKEIGYNSFHYGTSRCNSCAAKMRCKIRIYKTPKKYYCLDCGKKVSWRSKRCNSCAQKNRYKNSKHPQLGLVGKDANHWKGGKPHCKDCGKELKNIYAKRCLECYLKTIKGKNHPMWVGGISKEGYPNNFYKIRESIRNRDNYKCAICYKKGKSVHHIDYNKQNCDKNNLITLCNKCHSKTQANRDYWYAYFLYIME